MGCNNVRKRRILSKNESKSSKNLLKLPEHHLPFLNFSTKKNPKKSRRILENPLDPVEEVMLGLKSGLNALLVCYVILDANFSRKLFFSGKFQKHDRSDVIIGFQQTLLNLTDRTSYYFI